MSDAATPVNGAEQTKAPKTAPKAAPDPAPKLETEARSFAAEADQAREKLIATAIHRARARREYARRWALDQAEVAGAAVQSRPVTAIGFALGIGVIIGLLAAR